MNSDNVNNFLFSNSVIKSSVFMSNSRDKCFSLSNYKISHCELGFAVYSPVRDLMYNTTNKPYENTWKRTDVPPIQLQENHPVYYYMEDSTDLSWIFKVSPHEKHLQ